MEKRAYVVNSGELFEPTKVAVIDIQTNTMITDFIRRGSEHTSITPDGKRAYMANSGLEIVAVVDILTNTKIVDIDVGDFPTHIAITPDGKRAYVANLLSNTVSVIDILTNTKITDIPVGGNPSKPQSLRTGNGLM